MKPAQRSVAATVLATLLGFGIFWWGTDGFAAFTAETARRSETGRSRCYRGYA